MQLLLGIQLLISSLLLCSFQFISTRFMIWWVSLLILHLASAISDFCNAVLFIGVTIKCRLVVVRYMVLRLIHRVGQVFGCFHSVLLGPPFVELLLKNWHPITFKIFLVFLNILNHRCHFQNDWTFECSLVQINCLLIEELLLIHLFLD